MTDKKWEWWGRVADTAQIIQMLSGASVVTVISKFIFDMPAWQAGLIGMNVAFLMFAFGYVFRFDRKRFEEELKLRGKIEELEQRNSMSPPSSPTRRPGELIIHSALYGAKGKYFELRSKLQEKVVADMLDAIARFPDDPIPLQEKILIVLYSWGNLEPQYIALREGDSVTISQQSAGKSTLGMQDLFQANGEVKRLTDGLESQRVNLQKETRQMAEKLEECQKERSKFQGLWNQERANHAEDAEISKDQNATLLKKIAVLKQEIGEMKLYDLGKKETPIPFAWNVQIKYFDIADTELAEQLATIFNKTLWGNTITKNTDEHVPRIEPDHPRIHFIPYEIKDRETAIKAVGIFNEAQFLGEPGAVVLGARPHVSHLGPSTHITPDFYVEILPRKKN